MFPLRLSLLALAAACLLAGAGSAHAATVELDPNGTLSITGTSWSEAIAV
jgi:hypothetical protein